MKRPGVIIAVGVVIIFGYAAWAFVDALRSAPKQEALTVVSSKREYLLARCRDCHSERHPDPGCGELEDEAWVKCMESSELIKALHLQHEL